MTALSACKHAYASLLKNNIDLPFTSQALRMAIEEEAGIEAVREIESEARLYKAQHTLALQVINATVFCKDIN